MHPTAVINEPLVQKGDLELPNDWREGVDGSLAAAQGVWIVLDVVDVDVVHESGFDIFIVVEFLDEGVERSKLFFWGRRHGWTSGCCSYCDDGKQGQSG